MQERSTSALLVEDEEDAREILEFYLNTIFDEVETACDGKEGLDKFLEKKQNNKFYDIIITDIKMPKKDGLNMLEEISQIHEEQKFIIVSAYKDEEYLFRSINLNVISYFVKPLVVENIMEILKKLKKSILENPSTSSLKKEDALIKINESYSFDTSKDFLYRANKIVNLSKKETLLLSSLIKRKGEISTNEMLKKSIWNNENTADSTLRTVIKRVKDKIKDDDFILSKKGLGYIIE